MKGGDMLGFTRKRGILEKGEDWSRKEEGMNPLTNYGMCVCVCVCVWVCVYVFTNAHRQHIKNLTLWGGLFKEEKPHGSKCSRNGTFCYVNVVEDICMCYNIIPEHLPIQI